jgi:uncharacterized protein (DUF1015 family)
MAEIQPFNTVRYSDQYQPILDQLLTPPYDVISPAEQDAFYQVNPLNIIRLVLGKHCPDDTAENNRYTRAASTMKQWLKDGVLVSSSLPGLTIYQMEFEEPGGGRRTIDGMVAAVKVDDYGKGKVLPHEKTYKGPKQDQLNLTRACRANLTPIHGLFDDGREAITSRYAPAMQGPPQQEIRDANGTVHRTWALEDPEAIAAIMATLKDKSIFIADGHHRYETAMAYKQEMRAAGHTDPNAAHEYVMMYLTAMTHPGLTILPAHRMVKSLDGLDLNKTFATLEPYFEIEPLCFSATEREQAEKTLTERIRSYSQVGGKFGMVTSGDTCFHLLRLKDFEKIDARMDPSIPSSLRGLDVTILREIIMRLGLGMDTENGAELIEYTPLVSEAFDKVSRGRCRSASSSIRPGWTKCVQQRKWATSCPTSRRISSRSCLPVLSCGCSEALDRCLRRGTQTSRRVHRRPVAEQNPGDPGRSRAPRVGRRGDFGLVCSTPRG